MKCTHDLQLQQRMYVTYGHDVDAVIHSLECLRLQYGLVRCRHARNIALRQDDGDLLDIGTPGPEEQVVHCPYSIGRILGARHEGRSPHPIRHVSTVFVQFEVDENTRTLGEDHDGDASVRILDVQCEYHVDDQLFDDVELLFADYDR